MEEYYVNIVLQLNFSPLLLASICGSACAIFYYDVLMVVFYFLLVLLDHFNENSSVKKESLIFSHLFMYEVIYLYHYILTGFYLGI